MRRLYKTESGAIRTKVVLIANDMCLQCCMFSMKYGPICTRTMVISGNSKGILVNKLCSKLDYSVDRNKAVIFEKVD